MKKNGAFVNLFLSHRLKKSRKSGAAEGNWNGTVIFQLTVSHF